MIKRLSKHNDYKDIIKSCPSGVIDDIYAIEYYIQGYNTVIQANFTKTGDVLEVILPSSDLNTLPNGVLMRRAYYKVIDASYPDGYYNLQFEDNMSVWLGEVESEPGPEPVPGEYVTEEELAETLADYATDDDLSTVQYSLERGIQSVRDQVDSIDVIVRDLSDNTSDLDQRVTDLEDQNNVQYNTGSPLYDGYNKVITTFEPGNSYCPLIILANNEEGADVQYDGIKIDSSGIFKYSANNIEDPGSWTTYEEELATQNWVQNQGYATQQWVTGRGYITSSSTLPADQITCNISGDVFDFDDVDEGLTALVSRVEDQIDDITSLNGSVSSLDLRVTALEQGGIPAAVSWGSITGNIQAQDDLMAEFDHRDARINYLIDNCLYESSVWTGTEAQWNQLSAAQKAMYIIALITQ